MTFKNNVGLFHDFWVQHYKKNNLPIPEGTLGSNPADLSMSPKLKIIQKLIRKSH